MAARSAIRCAPGQLAWPEREIIMQTTVSLNDVASLLKLRLSVAVAAAAVAGFVLAAGVVDRRAAILFVCMLLVAAGAGCFNNWQDRQRDAGMSRTRNRPLPAGRISRRFALALAWFLMLAGGAKGVNAPRMAVHARPIRCSEGDRHPLTQ